MPKKKRKFDDDEEEDEEEEIGMDEEDLEDDELEELERQEKKKPVAKPVTKSSFSKPEQRVTHEVRKRFGVFVQPQRVGVQDTETKEIVGEGETAILEVLSDILERLERIETNLGSMMEH